MSHSKSRVWVHAVFSTKNRQPPIRSAIETRVHDELRSQLVSMGCFVDSIGGVADHVHILFLLSLTLSISDAMKQVKGGSSHAFNQLNLSPTPFAWQTGYGAFSISESYVQRVRAYISNQAEHPRTVTFMEEYHRFMVHYDLRDDDV